MEPQNPPTSIFKPMSPLLLPIHIQTQLDIEELTSVAISSDSQMIVSGSSDGTVRIWTQGENGQWNGTSLQGREGPVNSVAISSDSQIIVSGSSHKTVRIWNVSDGECLRILRGHTNSVNSVA